MIIYFHIIYGFFLATTAELSSCDSCDSHSHNLWLTVLKTFLRMALYRKSLPAPDSD